MLASISSASPIAFAVLVFCFVLVLAFETSNGFHDTANAVATVIYTHSLKPRFAVLLSGLLNFAGVLLGGVAVAYTLVELLPPDVLTPPDGNPAIAMLLALFVAALAWNVATWALGIPCSSSHAIIGALIGVSLVSALQNGRGARQGIDWHQVWSVLRALAISPVLGFAGAGLLFLIIKHLLHDRHLYEPTSEENPPVWWVRGLLILTCSGVSFAHGSNDGQKSIGLIMLTVIGIMPAAYTLNFDYPQAQVQQFAPAVQQAIPLIQTIGDAEKGLALQAAAKLVQRFHDLRTMSDIPPGERSAVRDDIYRVDDALRHASEQPAIPAEQKAQAGKLRGSLRGAVEYAPIWVRMLSAICLGIGTMVGYKRIVHTIGERIGKTHLTPAQGASAELVGAALIATAGFSGLPVSTTHIIASGVAGTMVTARDGVQGSTIWQIVAAWVLTLPATMLLAGGLFWVFSSFG